MSSREYNQAYYAKNRDALRVKQHEYYERDKAAFIDRANAWAAEHPEARAAIQSRYDSKRNPERYLKNHHGLTLDQFYAVWKAQGGCCYLCEDPLADRWAIDHDHACCPRGRSCDNCRRGITHTACNTVIGMAGDDPDRLEKIAANLRAAGGK